MPLDEDRQAGADVDRVDDEGAGGGGAAQAVAGAAAAAAKAANNVQIFMASLP